VAQIKPLQLKRERVHLSRPRAAQLHIALVLVEHQIVHLEQEYEYVIPEILSERAVVGALVEVQFGRSLTRGIILHRSGEAKDAGELREVLKVLSREPYLLQEQIHLFKVAAEVYGTNPWDFVRGCTPPFSKTGEREFLASAELPHELPSGNCGLPTSLSEFLRNRDRITCAIELPSVNPYWELVAEIAVERVHVGTVLIVMANERELLSVAASLQNKGIVPLLILTTQGKSDRYKNYLSSRSLKPQIILGLRSSSLLALPKGSTIIVVDDVDESHYERRSPTWNTRELLRLREAEHSVIYAGTSVSVEIADRIINTALPFYRFPISGSVNFHSATSTGEAQYFDLIRQGLQRGSVLISVGATGYVTSFSCQKCRNVALCVCGGKLYFPSKGVSPRCSICSSEFIEWSCIWCLGTKPRAVRSGVLRRAEEFGRAFPGYPVIHSSAQSPVPVLPDSPSLVLSPPGMEPKGRYAAIILLDLEGRLMRTTLRATEDLRLQILRTLSMLAMKGSVYIDLQPAEAFLQSILRSNPLLAAERELEERSAASLLPSAANIVISGDGLGGATRVLSQLEGIEVIGPFARAGKISALVKAPKERTQELVNVMRSLNRVQSMRKEGLLTYQINPYSLN